MNFNYTKAKKLIIFCLLVSFVFVLSFTKSPINRAIADDLVLNCEYDYTKTAQLDEFGNFATSADENIIIAPIESNADLAEVVSGCGDYLIRLPVGGADSVRIILPFNISQANIEITACMHTFEQDVSIDVKRSDGSSVLDEPISLAGSYAVEGELGNYSFSYNPITFSVTVNGGGEYIIANCKNAGSARAYIGRISVTALKQADVPFIPEYDLIVDGFLPKTISEYEIEDLVFTHLGWVNSNFEIVDSNSLLPAGRYYAVYASIEEKGASIKKSLPTGIRLGYKVHFYDNIYRQAIIDSGDIQFFIDFSLDYFKSSVTEKLNFYTLEDDILNFYVSINSVPVQYYKTDVSSKMHISFGANDRALCSAQPLIKNVYYVAETLYNQFSYFYNEESGFIFEVEDAESVLKYSKYTPEERQIFKTIMDSYNSL